MHAGDAFPAKMVPIMDSNNGGSGVDYPDTLRKASRGITNVDRIITGHGPVMTPADLSEYADFVSWFVSDVRAGKARGESAAEFVSGWQVPSMTLVTTRGRQSACRPTWRTSTTRSRRGGNIRRRQKAGGRRQEEPEGFAASPRGSLVRD